MLRALIFDFDGLILETETPIYLAWRELFQSRGLDLLPETWLQNIGLADEPFDPLATLAAETGRPVSAAELDWRRQRERLLVEQQQPLPGVLAYLTAARRLGLKVGLASSSPCAWVTGHLDRLGLSQYFDCIRARDDVRCAKPDPELYLAAAGCLGVPPEQAVAFEDSVHGLLAARQAGLFCVAVPNDMTRGLDFSLAHLRLASLAEMPLEELISRLDQPD